MLPQIKFPVCGMLPTWLVRYIGPIVHGQIIPVQWNIWCSTLPTLVELQWVSLGREAWILLLVYVVSDVLFSHSIFNYIHTYIHTYTVAQFTLRLTVPFQLTDFKVTKSYMYFSMYWIAMSDSIGLFLDYRSDKQRFVTFLFQLRALTSRLVNCHLLKKCGIDEWSLIFSIVI